MIELQIDTGTNGDVMFHPVGERVRGRFQVAKVNASELGTLPRDLPDGVPGQVIAFDPATSTGYIRDPLLSPENASIKDAIVKRMGGQVEFGPAEKPFPNAHAGTWTGWMRQLVLAGLAKVVKGKLPDSDPEDMRRSFYTPDAKVDRRDAIIDKLTALLMATMPADKRKELAAILGK